MHQRVIHQYHYNPPPNKLEHKSPQQKNQNLRQELPEQEHIHPLNDQYHNFSPQQFQYQDEKYDQPPLQQHLQLNPQIQQESLVEHRQTSETNRIGGRAGII